MNKLYIIGLGPGHKDYILPIAKKKIAESNIIIGAKRNLENIDISKKEIFDISQGLSKMIDYIKENLNKKIAVVVSGDTGFFSLKSYIKKNLKNVEMDIIPGISSVQYMFSRINESWEDAHFLSLHGRESDILEIVATNKKVAILTDKIWTPQKIAKELLDNGIEGRTIYIGENLSYPNEKIHSGSPEDIIKIKNSDLNVVVILQDE
ncbi:precorrin-6y C5,15-methyltransferase (decarboxylating) subunit CbiE [Senegalia massiliensis]|uniref:Precorrin-6y C5,15-methyltransferase (Decarboxylating) subunit CbiE n=1 Tax=Senegalia massiliensis TaxID=1720316 RepID=A0A845QZ65_9CLOT|nr:precorrin-6y C5,15-methyltransferase (decarboxylating) subunit CbiE [Senegalia massiliensis]NBI06478.1 precorrin-6y C5,15-methyltransferase (decarboxylating) subunit CbiE [Senegalia massiliensis]